jgi:hypothetical protein
VAAHVCRFEELVAVLANHDFILALGQCEILIPSLYGSDTQGNEFVHVKVAAMSGRNSILKQVIQGALIILWMSPVVIQLIGMRAGWNFMLVRRIVAVMILIMWPPFGVLAVYTGLSRVIRKPENAGFVDYLKNSDCFWLDIYPGRRDSLLLALV